MSKPSNKRWVLAVLMAVVFPALAIHLSCVAVLGPGSWGSEVEEKVPEFLPAQSNQEVLDYLEEFSHDAPDKPELPGLPEGETPWQGRVFWSDHDEHDDLWVVATYSGKGWTDQQHVYLWTPHANGIEEIDIARDKIVRRPVVLRGGERQVLVYERWNSWAVPAAAKMGRYLRSHLDATLRPEFTLHTYALETGEKSYVGPGHSLVASPNRRRAVFLRSGALGSGFYSLHVWNLENDRIETVVSLAEVDPGSGRSFDYRWSADSKALLITGSAGGFARRKHEPQQVRMIYVVETALLYDASGTGE